MYSSNGNDSVSQTVLGHHVPKATITEKELRRGMQNGTLKFKSEDDHLYEWQIHNQLVIYGL